jgi:hypothetical protein
MRRAVRDENRGASSAFNFVVTSLDANCALDNVPGLVIVMMQM